MFPEGTNLSQNTLEKSDKYALNNNLKPYRYVLHPRVTGFIHVFNQMNKKMSNAKNFYTAANYSRGFKFDVL